MPAPKNPSNVATPFAGDLDKVREILFGEEIRLMREEITALRSELQSLREELGNRIDAGKNASDEQLRSVNDSVDTLRGEQVSRARLAALLSELAGALDG